MSRRLQVLPSAYMAHNTYSPPQPCHEVPSVTNCLPDITCPLPQPHSAHLSVDVHQVPGVLELADVIVAQQRVLLIGVEQREVLHDDSCQQKHQIIISMKVIRKIHPSSHQEELNIHFCLFVLIVGRLFK